MLKRLLLVTTLVAAGVTPVVARAADPVCPSPSWSMYGHDASRSFSAAPGCSTITTVTAHTLTPKWYVHTDTPVTASPAVVNGTLYAGTAGGTFYALNADDGVEKWHFQIDDDHEVAFGKIESSAAVVPFAGADGAPHEIAVFGGGATLYALDAAKGTRLASIDLDPRTPELRAAQTGNPPQITIESSPVVTDVRVGSKLRRRIYVGFDVHNDKGIGRTGVVALELTQSRKGAWTLNPIWKFDPETARVHRGLAGLTEESGQGFGCGGVWSSPAVDPAAGIVAFGSASCSYAEDAKAAGENWGESMFGIRADDGSLVWQYRPATDPAESHLDYDFGASPNVFTTADGRRLVGEGRKDASYYARNLADGSKAWTTVAGTPGFLQDGFALGGFIGSTAVESDAASGRALRVVGATALPVPLTSNDPDMAGAIQRSTWAVRAMDAASGAIQWTYPLSGPAYGATTIANGVAFVPATFDSSLVVLDTATGLPLFNTPVPGPPSSSPVVVGNSVYMGLGTAGLGVGIDSAAGILAFQTALP